jgi:hypothetical protein
MIAGTCQSATPDGVILMRRSGRLIAAACAALVVAGATAGSAAASPVASQVPVATLAAAGTAQAAAAVHGCPAKDVCLYFSKAAYRHNKPTVVDSTHGVVVGGTADTVAVNNTASYFSSQGYIEERVIHGHYFCEYVPDIADVQAPGVTENPGDGANITGIDTATTRAAVTSIQLLPLSDCGS